MSNETVTLCPYYPGCDTYKAKGCNKAATPERCAEHVLSNTQMKCIDEWEIPDCFYGDHHE